LHALAEKDIFQGRQMKNKISMDLDLNSGDIVINNFVEYGKPIIIWCRSKKTGKITTGFEIDAATMKKLANKKRKEALKELGL